MSLSSELISRLGPCETIEQLLGSAHCVWTPTCDLAGHLHRICTRVIGQFRCQAERQSFTSVEDPRSERQFLRDVRSNETGQNHRARHVGHETPVDFPNGHLRVGVHDPDIGSETDLDSTAERMTVHRGDHRHGNLLPHPGDLLTEMGDATR